MLPIWSLFQLLNDGERADHNAKQCQKYSGKEKNLVADCHASL